MPTVLSIPAQTAPDIQTVLPLVISAGVPASLATVDKQGNVVLSSEASAEQAQAVQDALAAFDPTAARDIPSPRGVIQTAMQDPAVPPSVIPYLQLLAEALMNKNARKTWGG